MKKIGLLFTSLMLVFFLTGCATNFSNPNGCYATGIPTIRIVQQGSIPATHIYRSNFYIVGTNANTRAFLTPEIVAQMVAGGLTVISDVTDKATFRYYDMIKNNYRWRTDIMVSGINNLTDAQIIAIIEAGTSPQFDAQRSPALQRSVIPIKSYDQTK